MANCINVIRQTAGGWDEVLCGLPVANGGNRHAIGKCRLLAKTRKRKKKARQNDDIPVRGMPIKNKKTAEATGGKKG